MPRLYQQYSFQKREDQPADDLGNVKSDWVEQFVRRAERKFTNGREAVEAGALVGQNEARLWVRRCPGDTICYTWRLVDKRTGNTHNITSVQESHNRQYWVIKIADGVADG